MSPKFTIRTLFLVLLFSLPALSQQGGGGGGQGGTNIPGPTGSGQCFVSTASGKGNWTWGSCSGSSNLAFPSITAGTNTAALVMGTGGTLTVSGTGTITATNTQVSAGFAPTTNGVFGVNSTTNLPVFGSNGTTLVWPQTAGPTTNNFVTAYSQTTGQFTLAQPAFSNLSGSATSTQLPAALSSQTSINGTSIPASVTWPQTIAATSHKWVNSYTQSTGVFTLTQPASTDLSDYGSVSFNGLFGNTVNLGAGVAINYSSGTNNANQVLGAAVPSLSTSGCLTNTSGTLTWGTCGASGLSGMTAGQVAIAGSTNTITSSEALAGAGAGIVTGPVSGVTSGDVVEFTGTGGQIADTSVLFSTVSHCSASTAGSLCYWNGSAWTVFTGNTSGTGVFQETSSGVPSWNTSSASSIFTSYQFGTQTALTGSGLYLQTTYPSLFSLSQTGSGTSGSPYVDAITLASQSGNTIWGNWTNGSTTPSFNSVSICSGNNDAEQWTSGTGLTCGTSFAQLNLAQTFTATQSMQTILPSANNTYSLGSSSANWLSLYLDIAQYDTLFMGANGLVSGAANGITGQVYVSTNSANPAFSSPSLIDSTGSPASSSYSIQCDSSSTVIDRSHTIRLQSGASSVTVPNSTSSGCSGMAVSLMDDGAGTVTFIRSGSDTFSIFNGGTNSDSQTSFTITNGQYVTLNQAASALWEVRISPAPGSISGTQGNTVAINSGGSGALSVANTIHSAAFSSGSPSLSTLLGACPSSPTSCYVILDPGDTITVASATTIGSSTQWVTVEDQGATIQCTGTSGADCIDIANWGALVCNAKGSGANSNGCLITSSSTANLTSLVTNADHTGAQPNLYFKGFNLLPNETSIIQDAAFWPVAVEGQGQFINLGVGCGGPGKVGVLIEDGPSTGDSNTDTFDHLNAFGGGYSGCIPLEVFATSSGSGSGQNILFNGGGVGDAVIAPVSLSTTEAITSTGSQTVTVNNTTNLATDEQILITGSDSNSEYVIVTSFVAGTSITANFTKTHVTSSTVTAGQCAHSGYGCLVNIDGAAGGTGSEIVRNVHFNNLYFEGYTGSATTNTDWIDIRNCNGCTFTNAGFDAGPELVNGFWIGYSGANYDQGFVDITASEHGQVFTNWVNNSIDSYSYASIGGDAFLYTYGGVSGHTSGQIIDGTLTATGTLTTNLTTAGLVTTTSGGVIGSEASCTIAQGCTNATSAAAGQVPNSSSSSAASWTYSPTLGSNGNAGTVVMYPASGNFQTTLGSAATANNTFLFPATVLTNNHMGYCATSSTTCTWTDTGYAYNAIPYADLTISAANIGTLFNIAQYDVLYSNGTTAAPLGAAINGIQQDSTSAAPSAATAHQIAAPLQCADTSSSSTTYTCTTTPSLGALTKGDTFIFTSINQNNSGSSTLNIDGIGAVTIKKWQNTTNLASGDLQASAAIELVYDGTYFEAPTIGNAPSGGTTTNALTMNNSGSGASSGSTFNGSAAVTLSYNTLGAQQALTLTTTGTSGAATLSSGTLNIPQYSGGGSLTVTTETANFSASFGSSPTVYEVTNAATSATRCALPNTTPSSGEWIGVTNQSNYDVECYPGTTSANGSNLGTTLIGGRAVLVIGPGSGAAIYSDGTNYAVQWNNSPSRMNARTTVQWKANGTAAATGNNVGVGAILNVTGASQTGINATSSDGAYIESTTGTASGNAAGFNTGNASWAFGRNLDYQARVKLTATTTERVWITFGSVAATSTIDASDTPANVAIVGFRYSTNASDTNWMACSGSTTTSATCTSTGVAIGTTGFDLEMQEYDALPTPAVAYYVNNALTNVITSNLPASGSTWDRYQLITTLTTAAANLYSAGENIESDF